MDREDKVASVHGRLTVSTVGVIGRISSESG